MKDEGIKRFFDNHKQTISDEGFSERLFSALDCLPAPKPATDRSSIIILISALAGFLLFVALGGYSAVIDGLASAGYAITDRANLTSEIIVSVLLATFSVFAAGKVAIEKTR